MDWFRRKPKGKPTILLGRPILARTQTGPTVLFETSEAGNVWRCACARGTLACKVSPCHCIFHAATAGRRRDARHAMTNRWCRQAARGKRPFGPGSAVGLGCCRNTSRKRGKGQDSGAESIIVQETLVQGAQDDRRVFRVSGKGENNPGNKHACLGKS